jgi:hypothetical protein
LWRGFVSELSQSLSVREDTTEEFCFLSVVVLFENMVSGTTKVLKVSSSK